MENLLFSCFSLFLSLQNCLWCSLGFRWTRFETEVAETFETNHEGTIASSEAFDVFPFYSMERKLLTVRYFN